VVSAGLRAAIINMASGAALRGSPRGVHYAASKGGILSLTRAMALELAPYRVRVNAIAPGLTDTAQPRYGSSEGELVEMARSIPLGRVAQPDEIARAAVFWHPRTQGLSPVRPCTSTEVPIWREVRWAAEKTPSAASLIDTSRARASLQTRPPGDLALHGAHS
jgi:NAD(P)-dependent dehydrogenase (short-subunit alcohol dehydrogenase family)